jgi:tRNA-binding EMAP/Myf-like protein
MSQLGDFLSGAEVFAGGLYYKPGTGKCTLMRAIFNPKGNDGPTVIFETLVKEARPIDERQTNVVGNQVGVVCKLQKHKSAKHNVMGVLCAALNCTPQEFDANKEALLEKIYGQEQILRGIDLDFYTVDSKVTPEKPGPAKTYPKFKHALGNSKEEIAARRAELDKTNPITKA